MVALWEAYRREAAVAACMTSAGYAYEPAAEYPFDDAVKIASYLGLKIVRDPAAAPAERNAAQRDDLSDESLDGYYRSLIGESLATVRRLDAAGGAGAPAGYATGGCTGKAAGLVGSLWDTRRQLEPAWRMLTDDVSDRIGPAYRRCVEQAGVDAASPQEMERRLTGSGVGSSEAKLLQTALDLCGPDWSAAFEATQAELIPAFVAKEREVLADVERRYRGVEQRIRADEAFLAYLEAAT